MNQTVKNFWIIGISLSCVALFTGSTNAQNSAFDENTKKKIVFNIASLIEDHYVFPEMAGEISDTLKLNYENRNYKRNYNLYSLISTLNYDISNLAHDEHLSIKYTYHQMVEGPEEDFRAFLRSQNYGFEKVEMLSGDIGYLKLNFFADTEGFPEAVRTAEEAMSSFHNAKAIIFDLRENGGGSPEMIQLLSSYLFEGEPIHLNSFYWRETDSKTETWTYSDVKGERFPNTKVFILTSINTFSAAEEFTYNLKHLKRATIIGEVTRGGAHPVGGYRVNSHIEIFIPVGRAINPITHTNWEGVGVKPDVEVSAKDALDVAMQIIKDLPAESEHN